MSPQYHVYVSDRGNVFMAEIAALLSVALLDLGYEVVFPAPGLPERGRDRINLVVAPHEFFPLQPGIDEDALLRSAETAISVGVEQPGTLWFDLGAHYSSVALSVLDISRYAVVALEARGIEARHLQLGYHHSWDMWGGDPSHQRGTDVLFLGSITPRRDKILSSMASLLWDYKTDIRVFEYPRPMVEPRANFVAGRDKWKLLASSRVLLNVHRNDVPYFEWVRTLESVVNGCLVISEEAHDSGPLNPGEHFMAVPHEFLAPYATSFLVDEALRCEMTTAAYEMVRSKLEMTSILAPICADLETLAMRSTRGRKLAPFAVPRPPSPPSNQMIEDTLASEMRVRSRVKELMDSETALIRKVEAMRAQLDWGEPGHCEVATTRAWERCVSRVSVIVTSYNSEAFLADAIASVVESHGVATELIVVDDHSSDGSVDVVRQFMGDFPEFPMCLLWRAANGGVSLARNAGLQQARGEYVFILDSDNRIFPNGLERLSQALDTSGAAVFAYGLVAKMGDGGLLSYMPWDVERLCVANYIDAMAMIRRADLVAAGGYDPHFGLRGWEDYELWLRFAAAGSRGEFVPGFIGSYWVRPGSRQETVNLDNPTIMKDLQERYSFLPWS